MNLSKRLIAEFIGTFWVFGGVGAAVFTENIADLSLGTTGVALAFGLSLLTIAYAIGPISGCHINPAVTLGQWIAGHFPGKEAIFYVMVQVAGGYLAAAFIYWIASGREGFVVMESMAPNGYGVHSPGGYSFLSAFIAEVILTFGFVLVVICTTDERIPKGFAPIPIGLALTLVHLIGISITNMSVNPARSTASALWVGGWAISQLWFFWVAPFSGALLAGWLYRFVLSGKTQTEFNVNFANKGKLGTV